MKKIIVFCVAFLATMSLWASETSVKNADGVEIWYDFDSSTKTASVTSLDYSTREVVIPSTVTYESEEYNVTSIGVFAFERCSSDLISVTIPDGVTTIGDWAFGFCRYLTSIMIPESVTEIGESAFEDCRSLRSVTIPSGVTTIGDWAFYECGFTSITCKNTTPPTCVYSFDSVDKSIPVYVPVESVEAYKNAEGWKEFTNIQAIPSSSVANAKAETQDSVRKEYRDGQVLIIKGDKTYTMFGTEY